MLLFSSPNMDSADCFVFSPPSHLMGSFESTQSKRPSRLGTNRLEMNLLLGLAKNYPIRPINPDRCYLFVALLMLWTAILSATLYHPCLAQDMPPIPDLPPPPGEMGNKQVSKCDACRSLVKSFNQGMESTSRGKHEGGDTSWEERKLKSYPDSEVRLVEIQDQLCLDLKEGKAECLAMAEDTESDIEEWWFNQRRKSVRLMDFLCISRLKKCCPSGKFGPNCQTCPKDCGKNGRCSGSGTRDGDGSCICDNGFAGEQCSTCSDGYYVRQEQSSDEQQLSCLKCDSACDKCDGPGPLACDSCRAGYRNHLDEGCVDINECDSTFGDTKKNCQGNTYCVNTPGSYYCNDCHSSCKGCFGYGPNMCIECKPGYSPIDGQCQKERPPSAPWNQWDGDSMRSGSGRGLVYLVALLAAAVMFQRNVWVLATFMFMLSTVIFVVEFSGNDSRTLPDFLRVSQ